ncbi:unnamed protein product [Plutella xylostella]|uniref:(diamondback moth) hypothetical protein n=1 Tax=Plutella xylostella TaxID=51655 RepID=A0A8S4FKC0_PLUXY|nr:unnamed protein product [Plutella xylostella]
MSRVVVLLALVQLALGIDPDLDLSYLDPVRLQTVSPDYEQAEAAKKIISRYTNRVTVQVDFQLFTDHKDTFTLRSDGESLLIRASSGVAAVWGFNYYLKEYCKSQITWREQNVQIPQLLPVANETVVANDRFRYFQNVCTASYSFAWWGVEEWQRHVGWLALQGVNLALGPVAQEAAWARVYRGLGLTQAEIDDYFTGPAFLAWLRMGNVRRWGGPLPAGWHAAQQRVQWAVLPLMRRLGMVAVLPAFSGHVPRALARVFPNVTLHSLDTWNKFGEDYCCGAFLEPSEPLFRELGRRFLREVSAGRLTHVYSADPFNEVQVQGWSTALAVSAARAIHATLAEVDPRAVWLLQGWAFVHDPLLWPLQRVEAFLTAVPRGRVLVLDLQAEQWPQYHLYRWYFGQPFVWCMLHNFGGTLGMFGGTRGITREVHAARAAAGSTMVGTGMAPEGIYQNYVIYDLMTEAAWRREPLDLNRWVRRYAERRYGCNSTGAAWDALLASVYSFDGLNKVRGKYVITRAPSSRLRPWAWYRSRDLLAAWRQLVFAGADCATDGFRHDLADVTRQALQYRAAQLYLRLQPARAASTAVFNATVNQFLDILDDLETICLTNENFSARPWLEGAKALATNAEERYLYDFNARNQITMWGPNGEISDYACKQWAELFRHYYTPRWSMFLRAAVDAHARNEFFDEKATQDLVRFTVSRDFFNADIQYYTGGDVRDTSLKLFRKWWQAPGLADLPMNIIRPESATEAPDEDASDEPTVVMLRSTTAL